MYFQVKALWSNVLRFGLKKQIFVSDFQLSIYVNTLGKVRKPYLLPQIWIKYQDSLVFIDLLAADLVERKTLNSNLNPPNMGKEKGRVRKTVPCHAQFSFC